MYRLEKKLKNKIKRSIISKLRSLSGWFSEKTEAKKERKLAPATYKCDKCKDIVYEGAKDIEKVREEYKEKYKLTGIKEGKIEADHKYPVVPVEGFGEVEWSWDIYIDRLFCPKEEYNILCSNCHSKKSKKENKKR